MSTAPALPLAPARRRGEVEEICESPGSQIMAADESIHSSGEVFPSTPLGDAIPTACPEPAPGSSQHGTFFDPPGVGTGDGSGTLAWPGMTSGVSAVVAGGSYAVDTDKLTDFATALTSAADRLDDARRHVLDAVAEARAAVAPPEGAEGDSGGIGASAGPGAAPVPHTVPYAPGATTMVGPLLSTPSFETLRTWALDAAKALTSGPGSLQEIADALYNLAADVQACVEVYSGADNGATTGPLPISALTWGAIGAQALGRALPTLSISLVLLGQAAVMNPSITGLADDDTTGYLDDLAVILSDADLSGWVEDDLVTLAALVSYAKQARTGREAALIETYLAGVARRLDPEITKKLPSEVQIGSGRMVPTSSLTSMERVVYYMASLSSTVADRRYGEPTGTTVTARDGTTVTVPPSAKDPMALGTAVPRVTTEGTAVAGSLGTAADVIRYSDSLKRRDTDPSSGVVSIVRTTHADGSRSWMVVVPGTTDWGLGGSNPQDLLTNLQTVAGAPNDMESAVVTAMREAGIAPDEPVGFYGHSQGAITAANIVADPAVTERYNVTTLLTAGGPTAGAEVPESVNALHIENGADAVPALDGAPTPRSPTRTVVTLDTTASDLQGYPHASLLYADAVEGMSGDPTIDAWTEQLGALTGAGEAGARTTELVFDITRNTTGEPVRGTGPVFAETMRRLQEKQAEAHRDAQP